MGVIKIDNIWIDVLFELWSWLWKREAEICPMKSFIGWTSGFLWVAWLRGALRYISKISQIVVPPEKSQPQPYQPSTTKCRIKASDTMQPKNAIIPASTVSISSLRWIACHIISILCPTCFSTHPHPGPMVYLERGASPAGVKSIKNTGFSEVTSLWNCTVWLFLLHTAHNGFPSFVHVWSCVYARFC